MELKDFKDLSEIKNFVESLDGLNDEEKTDLFNSLSEEFISNAMVVNSVMFSAFVSKLKAQRSFLSFLKHNTMTVDDYIKDFRYLTNDFIAKYELDWKVEFKKITKNKLGVYVNNILGCELNV